MNKVTLIGRLTKDPELKYTAGNGNAVASFTLAVDRRFANKDGQREARAGAAGSADREGESGNR